jgi:NTP pyrophosphatase (non-canonical NTP hydrolase)
MTVDDCRPEVRAFAVLMEEQLRRHDADRGAKGWEDDFPMDLLAHLEEEVSELREALCKTPAPTPDEIAREAADVANLAMMVCDVVAGLGRLPQP